MNRTQAKILEKISIGQMFFNKSYVFQKQNHGQIIIGLSKTHLGFLCVQFMINVVCLRWTVVLNRGRTWELGSW